MAFNLARLVSLFLGYFLVVASASCHYHSPPFPPPDYGGAGPEMLEALSQIEASVAALMESPYLNTSSLSIEITSPNSTLWAWHHTAAEKDTQRPGAREIDGHTAYRIASITKIFTVLGILQQEAAGKVHLADSIDKYLPDLTRPRGGTIQWTDITLRSLASQLSGIPRDWAQGDLINELPDPSVVGLPPPSFSGLPQCDSYADYRPCTKGELLDWLRTKPPVFAPNHMSTYSNIAFELLGLVLANVTGLSYEQCIQDTIFEPLHMHGSSFTKPSDERAVLPKGASGYWDVDFGVQNPTGGLYASSSDMSKFLRFVLTHHGGMTHALGWLQPVSFSADPSSFYGMPWEIFRTTRILKERDRPVTFYSKGGGLPGYRTLILLVPEYDLGITIFSAGNETLMDRVLELVTVPLTQGADRMAQRQAQWAYAGHYAASHINSSLELAYSESHGLEIVNWISNGTDMLAVIPSQFHLGAESFHAQVTPTGQYRDSENLAGELWRLSLAAERTKSRPTSVWDDYCVRDLDSLMYAGKPLNELVFWDQDAQGRYHELELTAFRVSLHRSSETTTLCDLLMTQDG